MPDTQQSSPAAERPAVSAEIERKFEVPDDFALPDLTGVEGVAGVAPSQEFTLEATYFDTAEHHLLRNRLTLRRRTGGHDAGWHLKRPRAAGFREEVHEPLGAEDGEMPAALRDAVRVHARGRALVPVVRLSTRRTATNVLAADGRVLAELAQDVVSAAVPVQDGTATRVSSWRELELELVDGDLPLLETLTERLVAAGAVPSASRSKLGRALGEGTGGDATQPDGLAPTSAGAVVLAYLRAQVEHLTRHDPLVRADAEDAVHQMRVASRRLRSALATYRPLLDRTGTDPIRTELQWLGSVLGAARDAEVVRAHLEEAVDREPAELVLGPVRRRVVETLGSRYREAHDAALRELDGERYFALLDTLDRLLAEPPFTDRAAREAGDVLPELAAGTYRRTRRLVDAVREVDATNDPEEHDRLLHEVRKAAKRARYAGESLQAAFGADAKRYAKAMELVQEILGEHQDSVVIRAELLELGVQATRDGDNAFTFGRLHALEQRRGNDAERRFDQAWSQVRRKETRALWR